MSGRCGLGAGLDGGRTTVADDLTSFRVMVTDRTTSPVLPNGFSVCPLRENVTAPALPTDKTNFCIADH